MTRRVDEGSSRKLSQHMPDRSAWLRDGGERWRTFRSCVVDHCHEVWRQRVCLFPRETSRGDQLREDECVEGRDPLLLSTDLPDEAIRSVPDQVLVRALSQCEGTCAMGDGRDILQTVVARNGARSERDAELIAPAQHTSVVKRPRP